MKEKRRKLMGNALAAGVLGGMLLSVPVMPVGTVLAAPQGGNGWEVVDGNRYWYENGVKQGTEGRGKEIYDPSTDAWYWLDAVDGGKVAAGKDVFQESQADAVGTIGKWVRYDAEGHMVKGWDANSSGTCYFDPVYGTMAKGSRNIDGVDYYFNEATGIMESCSISMDAHWETINGVQYWYEGGIRQGYDACNPAYRGKEIYDPGSDAWYWLDNVQQGAKAVSKDVYQESQADAAGTIGKWVRYNNMGYMIKGWDNTGSGTYYFDPVYGTMAKGKITIDGKTYEFDENTGILKSGGSPSTVPTPVPEPTTAPTPTQQPATAVKYSGKVNGLTWKITNDGVLTVTGHMTNSLPDWGWSTDSSGEREWSWENVEWSKYKSEVSKTYFNFSGAQLLTDLFQTGKNVDFSKLDTSSVTDMSYLFAGQENLRELDLSTFDTGNVTNMKGMFAQCFSLEKLNLSGFDTSKVTDMSYMFSACQSLKELDLTCLNTGNVTDMTGMFFACDNFVDRDFSSFDTSSVTSMRRMFGTNFAATYHPGEGPVKTLDLSSFDTGSVTDMSEMFMYGDFTSLDLSGFDTGKVTDMSRMFQGCQFLRDLDVSQFDTSKVTTMRAMFEGCKRFRTIDVSSFDIRNVTDLSYMFAFCQSEEGMVWVGPNWKINPKADTTEMVQGHCGPFVRK